MREPKIAYPGVPAYQWDYSEVATPDLLREMTTLARIEHFLWDPRGQQIIPQVMRDNYGALWCDGKLAPLVAETRDRAAQGDATCQSFWSAFDKDPIVVRARPHAIGNTQHQKDTNVLINQIHDLKYKYPEIDRHYGRVDLDNRPEIGVYYPADRRGRQLAALDATV